jgi:protein-S-isoprenylcysteine O-methyltransferase Ste14
MFTTICAYALIGVFFLGVERRMRKGKEAKSLRAGHFDRGSTWLIGVTVMVIFVSLLAGPVLNHFQVGRFVYDTLVGWAGVGIMAGGIALRAWASKTLGEFYTRTLLIKAEHRVVDQGPYRMVRHPGYLGYILMMIGAAFATANWFAVAIVTVTVLVTYTYRIHVEESMLQTALGEQYKSYMARTWCLVPFVY